MQLLESALHVALAGKEHVTIACKPEGEKAGIEKVLNPRRQNPVGPPQCTISSSPQYLGPQLVHPGQWLKKTRVAHDGARQALTPAGVPARDLVSRSASALPSYRLLECSGWSAGLASGLSRLGAAPHLLVLVGSGRGQQRGAVLIGLDVLGIGKAVCSLC